jgi:hypothetical protein
MDVVVKRKYFPLAGIEPRLSNQSLHWVIVAHYDGNVGGVRQRLWTAATNGFIIHLSGDAWAWKTITSTEEKTDSSTRAFWHSCQQSHIVAKKKELAKETCLTKYLFHTYKGFLTCRKILRHGADGFASLPKEGVLQIVIAPGRVWTREPCIQWQAR